MVLAIWGGVTVFVHGPHGTMAGHLPLFNASHWRLVLYLSLLSSVYPLPDSLLTNFLVSIPTPSLAPNTYSNPHHLHSISIIMISAGGQATPITTVRRVKRWVCYLFPAEFPILSHPLPDCTVHHICLSQNARPQNTPPGGLRRDNIRVHLGHCPPAPEAKGCPQDHPARRRRL